MQTDSQTNTEINKNVPAMLLSASGSLCQSRFTTANHSYSLSLATSATVVRGTTGTYPPTPPRGSAPEKQGHCEFGRFKRSPNALLRLRLALNVSNASWLCGARPHMLLQSFCRRLHVSFSHSFSTLFMHSLGDVWHSGSVEPALKPSDAPAILLKAAPRLLGVTFVIPALQARPETLLALLHSFCRRLRGSFSHYCSTIFMHSLSHVWHPGSASPP